MESDPVVSRKMSNKSLLEDMELDYRALGLARNPFESIPVFSESQPLPFNSLLSFYLNRLSSVVRGATPSRSVCIYLVGSPGSGKSTILRALSARRTHLPGMLPIYVRFPLTGGRIALYYELLRRLPKDLLQLMLQQAKAEYFKFAQTYIGRKLFWASMKTPLWRSLESMKISPQYTIESITEMCLAILDLTDSARLVLVLDEFEHAWARSTGAQKYNWEKTMVELLEHLGPKILLVLPVLPDASTYKSKPYLNMYNWKGVDMDRILRVRPSNSVEINCTQKTLKKCISSILKPEVLNQTGRRTCEKLLSEFENYTTIGDAITDFRGRVLLMAYKRRK